MRVNRTFLVGAGLALAVALAACQKPNLNSTGGGYASRAKATGEPAPPVPREATPEKS